MRPEGSRREIERHTSHRALRHAHIPENILERITFYDIDSRPLQKHLTDRERGLYLREIAGDITYFNRSFRRAHMSVDIAGCSPDEASRKVRDSLTPAPLKDQGEASERRSAGI
jgi:hypothetical protein